MAYKFFDNLKNLKLYDLGLYFFLGGIFFLPSSLLIGILLILPASIIGSLLKKEKYFKDKWNYPFFIFGIIITFNSFLQNFVFKNNYEGIWEPSLSFIGLANWLPFIWFFWSLQPYLEENINRKKFTLVLISSTFPVLISAFGQYFFNWTGPFQILNGLIIWYLKPIEDNQRLTGLFNNPNILGSWLNFVWPFCLAIFLEKSKSLVRKLFSMSFIFSVGIAAFLTTSRNAWAGLIITLPLVISKKKILFFVLFIILFTLLFFGTSSMFLEDSKDLIKAILPEKIWLRLSPEGFQFTEETRLYIFSNAFRISQISPITGLGASSFSAIHELEKGFWKGHSHNLLLELSISYGYPAAIILFFSFSTILIYSGFRIFSKHKIIKQNNYIEKAFWAASFFFLISQLSDIQYFDGKISLISWILLAGLKNIITQKQDF